MSELDRMNGIFRPHKYSEMGIHSIAITGAIALFQVRKSNEVSSAEEMGGAQTLLQLTLNVC